jgi:hypothetical protein
VEDHAQREDIVLVGVVLGEGVVLGGRVGHGEAGLVVV